MRRFLRSKRSAADDGETFSYLVLIIGLLLALVAARPVLQNQTASLIDRIREAATGPAPVSSDEVQIFGQTGDPLEPGLYELVGGGHALATGPGDDEVVIRQNDDGTLTVFVNGERTDLTFDQSNGFVILGGDGDDFIQLDDSVTRPVQIQGGEGDDILQGGHGSDVLLGGNGNDTLLGLGGNDLIRGGEGHDELHGGDGADRLEGEIGADTLLGGEGDDHLLGGSGNDDLFGGDDNDYVDGGFDDDRVFGDDGRDVVYGGDGDDFAAGGGDDDFVSGGAGNDGILGGDGNDLLSGGDGDDFLAGQGNDDTYVAGEGQDSILGDAGDSAYVEAGDQVHGVGDVTEVTIDPDAGALIQPIGSPEFIDRIEADLALLNAFPEGQALLGAIDDSGKPIIIVPAEVLPGAGGGGCAIACQYGGGEGQPVSTVHINTGFIAAVGSDEGGTPPVLVLGHELIHAEHVANGTVLNDGFSQQIGPDGEVVTDSAGNPVAVPNEELNTVGLPYDHSGSGTFDNPSPPADFDPPTTLVGEEDLREALGRDPRGQY